MTGEGQRPPLYVIVKTCGTLPSGSDSVTVYDNRPDDDLAEIQIRGAHLRQHAKPGDTYQVHELVGIADGAAPSAAPDRQMFVIVETCQSSRYERLHPRIRVYDCHPDDLERARERAAQLEAPLVRYGRPDDTYRVHELVPVDDPSATTP